MSETLDEKNVISFNTALIVAIIIVLTYSTISILLSEGDLKTDLLNFLTIITDILASLCLIYAAYNSKYNKKILIAWSLLAVSRLCFTAGDIFYAYLESVLNLENPFPSIADIGFLAFYPLFALGILMLPRLPMTSGEKLKVYLDIGIVMVSSFLVFRILLISPTIESNVEESVAASIISVAYPVADLVLLFALIESLFRRFEYSIMRPILYLIASMSALILSDFVYINQSLKGTWISGELWEVGFIIAYVLMGLGGIAQANLKKSGLASEDITKEPIQFKWAFYLPYLCEVLAIFLLVWGYYQPLPISYSSLSLTVGLIISMIIIRRAVDIKERKKAEQEIILLNQELEHRVEQRTSQLEITNLDLQKEIVDRKQAEMALKNSERRLADIVNFLPDSTVVINNEGKVIVWNKAIEVMTGIKAEAMLGKGNFAHSVPFYGYERPILVDLVLGKYDWYIDEYIHFEKDSTGVTGEVFIPTFGPKGSYLVGKATALYDADGNLVAAIETIRDVTERRFMEQKLEKTKTELHIASEIQRRFIPEKTPTIKGFDLAALTMPATEVGGDYFDIISLPDGKYGLLIADVAGKGIPAALFMALSRTIVRANAQNQSIISEILKTANNIITMDATSGMFVTLMYGVLDQKAHTFTYVNAGHLPPMIFRSKTRMIERGEVTGIALGAKAEARYEERILELSPGDLIIFYTDGVTESMNAEGEFYGFSRLEDIVYKSIQLSANELMKQIISDVAKFSGDAEQNDDLTLMILKASNHFEEHSKIVVAASDEEIPKVTSYIDEVMLNAGFNIETNLEVQLAVEELINNIIRHGYHGAKGTIIIADCSTVDYVMITIEDNAPKFDPTTYPEPHFVDDLDKRSMGGLGIHLARSLIDEMKYEFKDGKNNLSLIKRKN